MIERLESIEEKYNEITKELTKPETLNNVKLLTELSKKQSSLEETVTLYKRYKSIKEQIKEEGVKTCNICGHKILSSLEVCPYCKHKF